ncbi:nucleopolyhedrovirus P10 family protein [Streptomyces sp. NPDC056244]|uniref:nucleopolyhedrovirus P10 family protein n=1 Tax=Streptomyces sp. NPDC056244 TaxID=3345762 RepID=UPI0035DF8A7A
MTTVRGSEGWQTAVRRLLGLGRLLPLGGAADGAWLAERAAVAELRRAAAGLPGTVLGTVRLSLADPAAAERPAVPPPPSALPPGELRIEAEFGEAFTDMTDEPLPAVAGRLRATLAACAAEGLGLRVAEVDLRVTALLDAPPEPPKRTAESAKPPAAASDDALESLKAAAAVPGVARLTRTLSGPVADRPGHVLVEVATAAGHHPLEVARAVRKEVAASAPGGPSVAVLVTAVGVSP